VNGLDGALCKVRDETSSEAIFTVSSKERVTILVLKSKLNNSRDR